MRAALTLTAAGLADGTGDEPTKEARWAARQLVHTKLLTVFSFTS